MHGGMNLIIHSFEESLADSHTAEELPFWETIYRKAFPGFLAMHSHPQDGGHQRSGIDRTVILENSKQVLIDEKFRGRNKNGKVYADIALEYLGDEARKVPGWVCKPLLCDYIAYAIGPLGICYLLPVLELQAIWQLHGEDWIRDHQPVIRAFNKDKKTGRTWTTLSVGVPPEAIHMALRSWRKMLFDPIESQSKPVSSKGTQ